MKNKISRRAFLLTGASAALVPTVASKAFIQQAIAADDEACDALFVIRAQALSFDGTHMVLRGTDPNITYFCDRPVRTAGHLSIEALRDIMNEAENSFIENPPNAAISIFGDDGSVSDVVVTLKSPPKADGGTFDFEVTVIDGELPASGGAVAVFVDPVGVPMSPTSRAGVHRRHRRRAVRRHN
ncbi:MAG: hypothetical protein JSU95_17510 [Betaproteobacteria bacterium]|nr:MAG: hypothetical protein JSU95_17510 [Betaproteobacteria bacterium]